MRAHATLDYRWWLGVVVVLLACATVWRHALRSEQPNQPVPPRLETAVRDVFANGCISEIDAATAVAATLQSLGVADWSVVSDPSSAQGRCTTALLDGGGRRVIIVRAIEDEVRTALDQVTAHLMENCLDVDEAERFLKTQLSRVGEVHFRIRTDGALVGPIGQMERVARHFESGCTVFSSTGWDADGTRIYYLNAP